MKNIMEQLDRVLPAQEPQLHPLQLPNTMSNVPSVQQSVPIADTRLHTLSQTDTSTSTGQVLSYA